MATWRVDLHFRPDFTERVHLAYRDWGEKWLRALPGLVHSAARKWELGPLGPDCSVGWSYVRRSTRHGEPVVLKLVISDSEILGESRALEYYDGKGAVRLLDKDLDLRATLIEGADPGTPLKEVADEGERLEAAIGVLDPMLNGPPCPDGFPSFREEQKSFAHGEGVIEEEMLTDAMRRFDELLDGSYTAQLIHGDFHSENVLWSDERGWLLIDPDGSIADREFDAATMVRERIWEHENPAEIAANRVAGFSEALGLDPARLRSWAFTQCILSACWSIDDSDPGAEHTIEAARALQTLLE